MIRVKLVSIFYSLTTKLARDLAAKNQPFEVESDLIISWLLTCYILPWTQASSICTSAPPDSCSHIAGTRDGGMSHGIPLVCDTSGVRMFCRCMP